MTEWAELKPFLKLLISDNAVDMSGQKESNKHITAELGHVEYQKKIWRMEIWKKKNLTYSLLP